MHGAHADETFALPPTRLTLDARFPLLCTDPSIGDVVRLDPDASSDRGWYMWSLMLRPMLCGIGADMWVVEVVAESGVGGGDGRSDAG